MQKRLYRKVNFNYEQISKRPRCLIVLFFFYNMISSVIAHFKLFSIGKKRTKIPSIILESPNGLYQTLHKIWFTRLLRRSLSLILRTPLRSGTLALINYKLTLPKDSGCIIAIPHTPWSKLLAEWCRVKNFAIVLAGGPWVKRTAKINVPIGGYSGMRHLIKHLRSGGRVVVIGDNIGRFRCCPIYFIGKDCFASILPARLAAVARVPLLAVFPKFSNGFVNINNGHNIGIEEISGDQQQVIQKIFSYYEDEIRQDPVAYDHKLLASLLGRF